MKNGSGERFMLAATLAFVAGLFGCGGGGIDLQDVSGTVSFGGEPVKFGSVRFIASAQGENAGSGYATIRDGKFDTAADGRGVIFGNHQVRITGYAQEPLDGGEDEIAAASLDVAEPLFSNFLIEMDVASNSLTLEVPADAQGFNAAKAAAVASQNEP